MSVCVKLTGITSSALWNTAVRDSILESNPANKLSSKQKPHRCESNRTFLTIDEVKRLSDAKVSESDRVICEAFLFCCFCGLRYSDVSRLRWSQLHILSDGRYQLALVQKKTSKRLYLPPYWDINKAIDRWARNAGLDKAKREAVDKIPLIVHLV